MHNSTKETITKIRDIISEMICNVSKAAKIPGMIASDAASVNEVSNAVNTAFRF